MSVQTEEIQEEESVCACSTGAQLVRESFDGVSTSVTLQHSKFQLKY